MRPVYFSEFSYGFAVTRELVNDPAFQIVDPPDFPSLRREGQAGGGSDVRLNACGLIMYFQFKLSDYMFGPTAAERKLFPAGEYFRFRIRNSVTASGRTQHELLIELDRPGNEVYYIAPGFYHEQPWRDSYKDGKVVANSIMFSPAELGAVDPSTSHVVAFESAAAPYGWLCSEPARREAVPGKEFLARTRHRALAASPVTLRGIEQEVQKLCGIFEVARPDATHTVRLAEELRWEPDRTERVVLAQQLASLARSHLDCTLAIFVPP